MNNFFKLSRREFRTRLDYFLHPSVHIEDPKQLYGRAAAVSQMQDAFETKGVHPFIWGPRGIGKTSLGHTACEQFKDEFVLAAAIACGRNTTFRDFVDDLLQDAVRRKSDFLKNKSFKASVAVLGIEIAAEFDGIRSTGERITVSQAANLIDKVFSFGAYDEKIPVIIVDEFDRLDDNSTFTQISDLLKQLSVLSSSVKFCFCGVTDDLGELLAAHESVHRYTYGVELKPIAHDSVWSLIKDIEGQFQIVFDRGKHIRIGQIAAGYPHFAHLIVKNCLMSAYESQYGGDAISDDIFRDGLNRSAGQAATRLKTYYENAIRKGTDRYSELLFAVANSEHMNRQFKDIVADYEQIMNVRPNREAYDTKKNNGQDLRNALNSLHKRGFLKKGKTGWYQFEDPMLRSYVRLVAETEGIELSDDAFRS